MDAVSILDKKYFSLNFFSYKFIISYFNMKNSGIFDKVLTPEVFLVIHVLEIFCSLYQSKTFILQRSIYLRVSWNGNRKLTEVNIFLLVYRPSKPCCLCDTAKMVLKINSFTKICVTGNIWSLIIPRVIKLIFIIQIRIKTIGNIRDHSLLPFIGNYEILPRDLLDSEIKE